GPACSPRCVSSSLPSVVTSTTGIRFIASSFFIAWSNSRPFMRGMLMSSRTRSTSKFSDSRCSASFPSYAWTSGYCRSIISNMRCSSLESSTTRTLRGGMTRFHPRVGCRGRQAFHAGENAGFSRALARIAAQARTTCAGARRRSERSLLAGLGLARDRRGVIGQRHERNRLRDRRSPGRIVRFAGVGSLPSAALAGRGVGPDLDGHFRGIVAAARNLPFARRVRLSVLGPQLLRIVSRARLEAAFHQADQLRIAARLQLPASGWIDLLQRSLALDRMPLLFLLLQSSHAPCG